MSPSSPESATSGASAGDATAPMISVLIMTYNQERYIERALRSALNQDAPWKVEILVADDCSTDGTRRVLERLQSEFVGRFTVLPRPENLGLSRNLEQGMQACRGRYIAILEGDDEWIDPHKLTKVVAALEAHPEWTGCFHAARCEYEDGTHQNEIIPVVRDRSQYTLEDCLRRNRVPSYSSMTYRRGLVTTFPAWHREFTCGDWGLHCLHAAHGPLGFLPDVMTKYRVHAQGMWSGQPFGNRLFEFFTFWSQLDAHFDGRYRSVIEQGRREFLDEVNRDFADLKRIEQRYHALGLDRLAALVRPLKRIWSRDAGR